MTDDLKTREIDLGGGITFRFHGPEGDAAVYFGTIGDDSSISNDLIKRFVDLHGFIDSACPDDFFGGHVMSLVASSSDSVLLQFPESRRELVISQLREMLSGT